MSKRIFGLILIYMLGVSAMFAEDIVKMANAEYEKDHFDKAVELYEQAAKQEGTSSELYYNIGNCYYRMGDMGASILNYERALKLSPNNKDARTNLEFVKEKANVKDDSGASFFTNEFLGWITGYSSNAWATISVVLFVLFVAAFLAYIFMDNIMVRKIGFFGGGILLVLDIMTICFAFISRSNIVNANCAIVTVPSATLSTSPRVPKDKSEEAFLLNEGYKVVILDSVNNKSGKNADVWYDVKTDDQHRAWINAKDIEII